jgi:hypothetical protein
MISTARVERGPAEGRAFREQRDYASHLASPLFLHHPTIHGN